jgi:hypothetical protein
MDWNAGEKGCVPPGNDLLPKLLFANRPGDTCEWCLLGMHQPARTMHTPAKTFATQKELKDYLECYWSLVGEACLRRKQL